MKMHVLLGAWTKPLSLSLLFFETSYSVLIIQPELYTSKITFSGVFVMLKYHGNKNSY